MSGKIKLNSASGGGSFSLQAPSSSSNNRVFTLPDVADATMATVNGITMSELWRVTSSFGIDAGHGTIDANWEVADHAGIGSIGSSMSQSSGIFTFPSTGIYSIHFVCGFYKSGVSRRYLGAGINTTQNNSSYIQASINYGSIPLISGSTHQTVVTNTIFDVTDTSTHKCLFHLSPVSTISIHGHTDINYTFAMFTRLGDT